VTWTCRCTPPSANKPIGLVATAGGVQGLQAVNSMDFIARAMGMPEQDQPRGRDGGGHRLRGANVGTVTVAGDHQRGGRDGAEARQQRVHADQRVEGG